MPAQRRQSLQHLLLESLADLPATSAVSLWAKPSTPRTSQPDTSIVNAFRLPTLDWPSTLFSDLD